MDTDDQKTHDYGGGKHGFNYIVGGVMNGPMINHFPD
jgi:hypothetical protein